MEKRAIRDVATLYDFSFRYSVVKICEVFLQNVMGYILVIGLFEYFGDVRTAVIAFSSIFFVVHLASIPYFGRTWGLFIALMSPIGGALVVSAYLLVPNGILLICSFHLIVYTLLLLVVRRVRISSLRKKREVVEQNAALSFE